MTEYAQLEAERKKKLERIDFFRSQIKNHQAELRDLEIQRDVLFRRVSEIHQRMMNLEEADKTGAERD